MSIASGVLGFLLIGALTAAPLTGGVFAGAHGSLSSEAQRHERAAGCHANGQINSHSQPATSQLPGSPQPSPVRYQCCLTGHNVAALQASHSIQAADLFVSLASDIQRRRTKNGLEPTARTIAVTTDPPGMTPLRI